MSKYIYKFTNKITGQSYIGQTGNLKIRFNGHKSESFNPQSKGYDLPFHKAIREYGIENFSYDVLEEIADEENQNYIDSREAYFIKTFHSLTTENGYNIYDGGVKGQNWNKTFPEVLVQSRLFSKEEIIDIQNRLINDEEYDDIEAIYSPKLKRTFLCNINTGYNFFNPELDYPLKKHSRSKFSKKEIREIKNRIKAGLKYTDIQKEFNIKSASFLSMINSGKYFFDSEDTYPLCNKGLRKEDNKVWVEGIIQDLLQSPMTFKEIGDKWKKSAQTVSKINKGLAHKNSNLIYPLRKK